MTQIGAQVSTTAAGLVFIEPKPTLQARQRISVTNGLHEVRPNVPFTLLLANFTKNDRRLPKNTVIAYAQRSSVTLVTPPPDVVAPIAEALNIPQPAKPETNETDATATNETDNSQPPDWHDKIDLSHIDEEQRSKILTMLAKHSSMWEDGKLGAITATKHRIELEPNTKPIRSMPYRQGPAVREIVKEHVTKMLDAGVIEPSHGEYASPVVLAPKKDGTLRF